MPAGKPRARPFASQSIKPLRRALLRWFEKNRRSLPWRSNRSPYRVWISELMLQQTRVDQVEPYFRRFTKAFPTISALARADRDEVLKLWEGLGYYARARRAHETARALQQHGGRFPRTYEGLKELPGIGPYTAAAIGSIAMGLDVAVVDGNVSRVLSRLYAYPGDITKAEGKRTMQSWADRLLVHGRAADFNEAMMEIGAIICSPRRPRCDECPLSKQCKAYAEGAPEHYPVKKKKKKIPTKEVGAGVIINRKGQVLIAQRPARAMLGGLWEFPGGKQDKGETIKQCIKRELKEEMGIDVKVGDLLITVPHTFSHFHMRLHAHWVRIEKGRPRAIDCDDITWVSPEKLRDYAFPRADIKIIDELERVGILRW